MSDLPNLRDTIWFLHKRRVLALSFLLCIMDRECGIDGYIEEKQPDTVLVD